MRPADVRVEAARMVAARFGLDFPPSRADDLDRALDGAFPGRSPDVALSELTSLPADAPPIVELVRLLTVGETYFFRDSGSFRAIEHAVLAPLIARRRAIGERTLRLWSAGCATGEEAYSLAIVLDRLLPDREQWSVTLLATDVNRVALDAARRGRYRAWSFRETSESIQAAYFRRGKRGDMEIDPRIRAMVTFAPLNLVANAYPSELPDARGMDVILCRNVLMYLTRDAQAQVVRRLRDCLAEGGWLVPGAAEASAELFSPLAPVDSDGAMLFHRLPAGEQRQAPPAPATTAPATVREAPRARPVAPRAVPHHVPATQSTVAPASSSDLLRAARAAADQGDLALARTRCAEALDRDPLDVSAHLLLADICREDGDRHGARAALRRAIFLAPDSAAAHFALGALLLRDGQRQEAARALRTAIRGLEAQSPDVPVPGAEGLTAGRIVEMARDFLRSADGLECRQAGGLR